MYQHRKYHGSATRYPLAHNHSAAARSACCCPFCRAVCERHCTSVWSGCCPRVHHPGRLPALAWPQRKLEGSSLGRQRPERPHLFCDHTSSFCNHSCADFQHSSTMAKSLRQVSHKYARCRAHLENEHRWPRALRQHRPSADPCLTLLIFPAYRLQLQYHRSFRARMNVSQSYEPRLNAATKPNKL